MNEYIIRLHRLEFFGYHGLYPEEKQQGNVFYVDVEVTYQHSKHNIPTTTTIVDYSLIYKLIAKRMTIPTELLEVLADDILNSIKSNFTTCIQIKITVEKKNPPLGGPCQSVSVTVLHGQ